MHLFSTLMVFLGSVFSAVWIVVANSWQQTPAGYHIVWHDVQGEMMPRAEIIDFWAMVFNPSSVDRLTHTLVGALVLGAFFVASVCSYYLLKNRHKDIARRCLSIALPSSLVFTLAAAITGHDSAKLLVETQPAKLAAMEAHFETTDKPTGLYLFGWPDAEEADGPLRAEAALPAQLDGLRRPDEAGAGDGPDPAGREASRLAPVPDLPPDGRAGDADDRSRRAVVLVLVPRRTRYASGGCSGRSSRCRLPR